MNYQNTTQENNNKLSNRQVFLSFLMLGLIFSVWIVIKSHPNTVNMDLPIEPVPEDIIDPNLASTLPLAIDAHLIQNNMTPVKTREKNSDYWQDLIIKKNDNLMHLFKQLHFSRDAFKQVFAIERANNHLNHLKPNNTIRFLIGPENKLKKIDYQIEPAQHLILDLTGTIPKAHFNRINLESHIHHTTVIIKNSFFNAGKMAGLTDQQIYTLVNYFAWELDFSRDVHPGDQISVLYEDYYLGDKKIASGPVIAANFNSHGQNYQIIRFETPDGDSHYYDANGKSIRKAFVRSPVRYTRISSTFDLKRRHPILHYRRPHEGIDLAAPYGTPIRTTGEGRISFRGWKGGYGKMVIIKHNSRISTRYGHMSRFYPRLKSGTHVKQGQIIGYVGTSGLASGPHVHYEFRINQQPHNPLKIVLPPAHPVPKDYQQQFLAKARGLLAELNLYQRSNLASKAIPHDDVVS